MSDDISDAEFVTRTLIERKLTVTFMESCTSGLLASMFTDTEGASAVFYGSAVTYSNREKINAGVDPDIIERHGVYSSECARAMAQAARRKFGADIAVSITGSTGNTDPANPGSVTGEAFYCICTEGSEADYRIKKDVSGIQRKEIKEMYAAEVYRSLALFLKENII